MNTIHPVPGVAFGHFSVLSLDSHVLVRSVITTTLHAPKIMTIAGDSPWFLQEAAKRGRDLTTQVVTATV